jgi:hypothetical protein
VRSQVSSFPLVLDTRADNHLAAQSFMRGMVGGAFPFFTPQMYDKLTPRWGTFLFGCLATLLIAVPFIAFFYGPQIRKRSKFAIALAMEEERIAQEKEKQELARVEKEMHV